MCSTNQARTCNPRRSSWQSKGPKRSGNRHKRARQVRLVLPNRDSGGVVPGRALNCTCFDLRVQVEWFWRWGTGWRETGEGENMGDGEDGGRGREEGRGGGEGEARSPPTTVPRHPKSSHCWPGEENCSNFSNSLGLAPKATPSRACALVLTVVGR